MDGLRTMLSAACLVGALALASGCSTSDSLADWRPFDFGSEAAAAPERTFHGVWVTRMDFTSARDVNQIIEDLSGLGATDVFWQVRGQADAYYAGGLEPRGELLPEVPAASRDIEFDPLATAIAQAHARGMRIHAWVNVMPLWKGTTPPKDTGHPFFRRPQWRLRDATGTPQPLFDGYVTVNPVLEEVHDHIVAVCTDIVRRYDVDGLHLDYIRFIPAADDGTMRYPSDAATVAQFERAMRRTGLRTAADRAAFRGWIRDRITALVRRIHDETEAARPGIELSAAIWRRPDLGRDEYLQDGARWLREGLIDRGIPMIYTENDRQFEDDWRAWREAAPGARLSAGIGVYKLRPEQTAAQTALASGTRGVCLFSYASMFDSVDRFQDDSPSAAAARQAHARAVERLLERLGALAAVDASRTGE